MAKILHSDINKFILPQNTHICKQNRKFAQRIVILQKAERAVFPNSVD